MHARSGSVATPASGGSGLEGVSLTLRDQINLLPGVNMGSSMGIIAGGWTGLPLRGGHPAAGSHNRRGGRSSGVSGDFRTGG
jgi:hypothetical protein